LPFDEEEISNERETMRMVGLETVCCILDQFSITWIRKAIPFAEEVDKLKSEKISDQSTIIDLQNKVI